MARRDTGMAWAEDPPSRTRHLIGNLKVASLVNGGVAGQDCVYPVRTWKRIIGSSAPSGCREDVPRKSGRRVKGEEATIALDGNVLLHKKPLSLPSRVKNSYPRLMLGKADSKRRSRRKLRSSPGPQWRSASSLPPRPAAGQAQSLGEVAA